MVSKVESGEWGVGSEEWRVKNLKVEYSPLPTLHYILISALADKLYWR